MKIQVILGSVREGRLGDRVAKWVMSEMKNVPEAEFELVDVKDYPMPFFDEPFAPFFNHEPYKNEAARNWCAKLNEADAYLFVTAEYNHSVPAVLKNAIDYLANEVRNKPVGIVSYSTGMVGGARAAEHLVQIFNHMVMPVMPGTVSMGRADQLLDESGALQTPGIEKGLANLVKDLLHQAKVLPGLND